MSALDRIRLRVASGRTLAYLGYLLFLRDFQYRFRLTYFGYTWAVLRPLLVGVPLIMVGTQFNFGAGEELGVSYPLFALSGLLLWQIFWDALFYPQWVMRRVRRLLTRVRFPYKAVLVAACCYVGLNVVVYVAMLAAGLVVFGAPVRLEMLLGVLSIPLVVFSGLAIGTFFAPVILVYLDLRYGLPLASGVLIWTIPVVYVTPPDGPLHVINTWNPITYLLNTPRAWLIGGGISDVPLFVLSFVGFIVVALLSFRFYERACRIGVDHVM